MSRLALGGAAFYATALLALLVPVAVLLLTAEGMLDARLHALGCTLILHKTGEVAFRLPSGRLLNTSLLEFLDVGVVCFVCTLCLLAWTSWMIVAGYRRKRKEWPRGFPVD